MYQEIMQRKNKWEDLKLNAGLILKLEEAENLSRKVQIFEDFWGKNCNFDLDKDVQPLRWPMSDNEQFGNHGSAMRQR